MGIKVAVLMGALGPERQISLDSGRAVAEAIRNAGYDVIEHDYKPGHEDILDDESIDIYFLAFHGEFGEGGDMQDICQKRGLIYTGSGPEASRLAFDKIAGKRAYKDAKIDSPRAFFIEKTKDLHVAKKNLAGKGNKFVIKPARQGSSVGVCIVDGLKDAITAAEKCFQEFGPCLIEQFLEGREFTVGIVGEDVLPIIEIKTENTFYDYHAKYIDNKTQFLFDTVSDPETIQKINSTAIKSFKALGCRDFARVDIILDSQAKPNVIEINTIPGFTTHSLLPKAAARAGMDMTRLCMRIVEMAKNRN